MFGSTMLAVLLASAPAAPAAIPHETYTLDNGLTVVLHEDHLYPLVAVRLVYHVGSMHDPPGKEGVAHLLEHAMFGGSAHVAEEEHFKVLASAGASLVNAQTWLVSTVYIENVPANQLELALWLESDRMGFFDVRRHRRTLEKERKIVNEELAQRRHADGWTDAVTQLRDLLVPEGHPMHSQDGHSLAAITLDDVQAMAERHYGPANATLILAGDLPDDIEATIEKYFGSLRGGERLDRRVPPLQLPATREKLVESPWARAPAVFVAWPTPGRREANDIETDVLARLLTRRGTSHLDSSIVAGIDAEVESHPGQSILYVRVDGRLGGSPQALLTELDRMLAGIAEGELTDREVAAASKHWIVALHRELGSLGGRADRMHASIVAGKSPDSVAQDEQLYRRVTRASVQAFVRKSVVGRPRAVLLVAPRAGKRA